MKRIFKYDLPRNGIIAMYIPKGGEILSVGNQRECLVMWVLVDENEITELLFMFLRYDKQ